VFNLRIYIDYEGKDIKQQTRAVWLQVEVRGCRLELWPRLNAMWCHQSSNPAACTNESYGGWWSGIASFPVFEPCLSSVV